MPHNINPQLTFTEQRFLDTLSVSWVLFAFYSREMPMPDAIPDGITREDVLNAVADYNHGYVHDLEPVSKLL